MAEVFDFGLQQHKIKMDGKFFENNLFAVAGDTGRRLEVQLLDSDNLVQNTTGISLRLNADVAGQATYAEATLVDVTKGLYELDLPNGMLIAPGNWQFQWQIIDSAGEKLHSFAFMGTVGSNLSEGGTEATNFYLNVDDLKEMQQDFIDGALDSASLITNIEEKLVELEEDYAPRLLRTEQQIPFKADTSYVDAKIGDLGAVANWKGSATNAVILAKTGMAIGDEWFDTTNNVSLRWNGTSWINVGSGTKIGDETLTTQKYAPKSVTPEKLDGVIRMTTLNQFNLATITQGSYIAEASGLVRTGVSSYFLSDYIPVTPSAQYIKTGTLFTGFYKSKGVPSTVTGAVSGSIFTTPSDTNFIRTTMLMTDLNTGMVTKGNKLPVPYVAFDESFEFDKTVFNIRPTNVENIRTRNLFNSATVTFGGYYDAAGVWVAVPTYGLSEPIPVNEGEVVSKLTTGFSSWLDASGNWLGSWHTTRQTRVPKNAKALRAITNTTNAPLEMVVKGYEYPTSYIPYNVETFDSTIDVVNQTDVKAITSPLYKKKWAFLGDSISDYVFSYPHLIAPKYDMTLVNMALSGRSMAKRGEPTDTNYPPLINIYQTIPTDVDIISIWIGTNDKGSNVALGTINSVDETTFMGAYNVMLTWIIENRPNAKILLITPMQRSDSTGITGNPLIDYVTAVEQLGTKYGKRVLNMYKNSGIYVYSEVVKTKFIPDGLHPNYDGHRLFITPPIEHELSAI